MGGGVLVSRGGLNMSHISCPVSSAPYRR